MLMIRIVIIHIVLFFSLCGCDKESAFKSHTSDVHLEKLIKISQELSLVGQWEKSLQLNHLILDMVGNSRIEKKNKLLARVYIQLGKNLRFLERYEQSLEVFLKCLEICKEPGLEREKGSVLYHIGDLAYLDWAYFRKKNTDEAFDFVQQSLEIRKQISDSTGISESLYRLGTIYQINGEHSKAKEIFDEALNIAIENQDTTGMIDSYTHLAVEYQRSGVLDSALLHHQKAYLLSSSQNNNYLEAHSLNNLAGSLLDLERLDEASQKINSAVVLSEELGNYIVLCKSYFYMGQLFKKMQKPDKSREYFQKGLSLAKVRGYQNFIDAFNDSLKAD
jgi:tetratricopeptide (TPR) repeat protein